MHASTASCWTKATGICAIPIERIEWIHFKFGEEVRFLPKFMYEEILARVPCHPFPLSGPQTLFHIFTDMLQMRKVDPIGKKSRLGVV